MEKGGASFPFQRQEGISPGFSAVTALGTNNVWAVGNIQNSMEQLQTLIAHWDGTKWSVVQSPNRASLNNELSGVAAVSANDIWAVGSAIDNSSGTAQTLIEHWDGTQWSIIPTLIPARSLTFRG